MRRRLLLLGLGLSACVTSRESEIGPRARLEPYALTTEGSHEPRAIESVHPRLAWKLRPDPPNARGARANAYAIQVASDIDGLTRGQADLWDSGVVLADTAIAAEYAGAPLAGRQHAWWRVRVQNAGGGWSDWSPSAHWCTAPRNREDWGARWIGPAGAPEANWHLEGARWITGGRYSRQAFTIAPRREIVSAELLLASLEPLEVLLDGATIATHPGGAAPVELDVAAHLEAGDHVLGIVGGESGVLARLRVYFREGTELRLETDEDWRVASEAPGGWCASGFDAASWAPAELGVAPSAELAAALGEHTRADPWLRTTFELEADVVRATAWVASIGYHELHANGVKVGRAVLAPGVSDLGRRARFVAYDLTMALHRGRNALGLWLSAGWGRFERYGVPRAPLVLARVDVEFANGARRSVVTDETWRAQASPSRHVGGFGFADFGGERWDARENQPEWCAADFDDGAWQPVEVQDVSLELSARRSESDEELDVLTPVAIDGRGPNGFVVDFGRGCTGFLEAELRGEAHATVTLTWSERAADETTYAQRSECVLDERGRATFRNRFDYASGRWLTLRGALERPAKEDLRLKLVRSAYEPAGEFACSDELLQRIHDAITWTYQCLSQGGIIADCPHRERLGYGGDAHATLPTGLTHFALANFYRDWLVDWSDTQGADGGLPYTAPTYMGGGGPAWSGIVAYLPWELYVATGDKRVLADAYPTARRWLEFAFGHVHEGLLRAYGDPDCGFLGDWVPPGRGQGSDERVDERSTLFFNNAYLVLALERMTRTAAILGDVANQRRWKERADELRAALHTEFFDAATTSYANGEQPYLALALLARVVPEDLRDEVLARLEHEIRVEKHGHVDSGIHGTAFLLQALTEAERPDLVVEMARQTDYPSWGHMLAQGATTIWEQWDGVHSRCHSSFLSLGAWFVQGLAGLRPDPERPGYEHVIVRPGVVGDLTWARARHDSPRGPIEVAWRCNGRRLTLDVHLPPGASATVFVPTSSPTQARESGRPARLAPGVRVQVLAAREAVFEVDAGHYTFDAPLL
jgi:alpha-L-rhamnosidase